jgi:hypothetical protein
MLRTTAQLRRDCSNDTEVNFAKSAALQHTDIIVCGDHASENVVREIASMTDVLITIDTEFSAGGYFGRPDVCTPVTDRAVFCTVGGRSHGLGFILETLSEFRIRATFFVEAAHTVLLGIEPMRPAVNAILEAGHDIQLHIHPMWMAAKKGHGSTSIPNDSMAVLDEGACRHAIEIGQAAFAAWGVAPPLSFRAGNLEMGRAAYRALKSCGIPISSSIGVAVSHPQERALWLEGGRRVIEGVVEVPVLAFANVVVGAWKRMKNLTVTGSGTRETIAILQTARTNSFEEVILQTHPFEFIKKSNGRYDEITPNRVNQCRFRTLCDWLAKSSGAFPTVTIRERATQWIEGKEFYSSPLVGPFPAAFLTAVENKMNDWFWWY